MRRFHIYLTSTLAQCVGSMVMLPQDAMNSSNIEPELNSLLSKLAIEIESDTKEIEIRKRRIEKNEALRKALRGSLSVIHPEVERNGYGSKSGIIRDAISRIGKPHFTQDDVEGEIRRAGPTMEVNRSRIRSALWTMAEKKEIKLVRKGTNKEPAQYEKYNAIDPSKRLTEAPKDESLRNMASPGVTAGSLEDSVRTKSGRVDHLAKRLSTDTATIQKLLEPASKVYVGSAGWLRVRE